MICHPAYIDVGQELWQWLINAYSQRAGDPCMAMRIHAYWWILSIWWVVRTACYLYEVPLGRDERLVERPPEWLDGARYKFDHYAQLAQSLWMHA